MNQQNPFVGRRTPMLGCCILALLFLVAGGLHFVIPQKYIAIVPPYLPAPATLVRISGAAEILGGFGLIVPFTRRAAAMGLIVLLIVILPANIHMLANHSRFSRIPLWALWLRLPLQLPLIYWTWRYARQQ